MPTGLATTATRSSATIQESKNALVTAQPLENAITPYHAPDICSSSNRSTTHSDLTSTHDSVLGTISKPESWSEKDDEILIHARAQGLNWNQISPKHFPHKSANACRKRHERLMERENAGQRDDVKLDILSQAYMETRREMWSVLAARVEEKWTLVEQKCMEKGIETLTQASRAVVKRQDHTQTDSGYDSLVDTIFTPLDDLPGISDARFSTYVPYPTPSATDSRPSSIPHMPSPLVSLAYEPSKTHHNHTISTYLGDMKSQMHPLSTGPINGTFDDMPTASAPDSSLPDSQRRNEALSNSDNHESVLFEKVEPMERTNTPPSLVLSLDQQQSLEGSLPKLSHESISQSDSVNRLSTDLKSLPSGETSSACNSSEDDGSDMTVESLDSSEISLDAEKDIMLDRLVLCLYEMFADPGYMQRGGGGVPASTTKITQAANSVLQCSAASKRKRKSNDKDQGDQDDGEEDKRKKRSRKTGDYSHPDSESGKRLACPYYQRNPDGCHPSRACAGPGWLTVHRLKEHLYREHAMFPHCRRCYTIFDNEAQLTEHSRAIDTCIVTDAPPPEGFDKDQEKKLKDRSKMFRADSEEHKWKIVYLILFPDTPLFELPSPYHEPPSSTAIELPQSQSPTPLGLKQWEAFMSRELPRKVRKALEAEIEGIVGPIEETLKNKLEDIVRECQETLRRVFLDNVKAVSAAGPSCGKSTKAMSSTLAAGPLESAGSNSLDEPPLLSDGFAQIEIPPYSAHETWTEVDIGDKDADHPLSWEDSAYFSLPDIPDSSLLDGSWLHVGASSSTRDQNGNNAIHQFEVVSLDEEVPMSYTGKGKGRAIDYVSDQRFRA